MTLPHAPACLTWAACALVLFGCATSGGAKTEISRANMQLGTEYMQQGRLELALASLEKAVKADPNSAAAHAMLGVLYARLGREPLAEEHHRSAVERVSENSADFGMVHNNYGTYLCDRGRFREAEEHFMAAAKSRLYDTPEAAYENAGLCALKAGQVPVAEGHFREELALRPEMPQALFQMAKIHYDTRRYLLARAFIQRFQAAAAENAASASLGMQIEMALGDREAMQRYAAVLRSRFPDSDETKRLDKPN